MEETKRKKKSIIPKESAPIEENDSLEEISDNNSEENEEEDQDFEEQSGSEVEEDDDADEDDENENGEEDNSEENNGIDEEEDKEKLYKEAKEYRDSLERRGVIYMSRVPPFLKPNKARNIFEQYGEVTRLFLAEENPEYRQKRKAQGGNGSKQFREGWIEFANKKIAKRVAESLNNTPMGGKKGDYHHDDIWNLKYLKGFKWEFLTEKVAYEKRIRESKLRTALRQSKKEIEEMKDLIEKTEVEEKIQNRKRSRNNNNNNDNEQDGSDGPQEKKKKFIPKFRQEKAIATEYDDSEKKINSKLLHRIFKK